MTKKGDEAFDSDLDFGGFAASSSKGDDFSIDEMPSPGSAGKPKPAQASEDAPRNDFADFGGDPDTPPEPVRSSRMADISDDAFGVDSEQPRQMPGRGRAVAVAEDDVDEGFVGFKPDEDEEAEVSSKPAHDAGFDDGDDTSTDANDGDEDEADDEDTDESAPDERKARLIKIATLAGAAALGAVGIFGAWSYVLQPILGPLFGLDAPAITAVAPPTPVGQQVAPRSNNPLPPLGNTVPAPSQPRAAPSLPPQAMPTQNPAPMQAPAAAQTRPDQATLDRMARLEALVQELVAQGARRSELDQKLVPLNERIASLEARGVSQMPKPTVDVPLKPEVLAGWKLKGVSRGVAWVEGPSGATVQVKPGEALPNGAGTVKQISKYENDFVVVTERGVIVRK